MGTIVPIHEDEDGDGLFDYSESSGEAEGEGVEAEPAKEDRNGGRRICGGATCG